VKIDSEVAPGPTPTNLVTRDPVGTVVVVAIAVVASLGLVRWLGLSMFADEGATLYSAHLSWSDLWAQSQYVDRVLLPYYVLVHFWLVVSGSIEWVRALSLIAYFGTIVVVGWTGLRIAGRWCGIIASVLTATSTVLVEKSLNARPYELSTFLVALSAVALLEWLDDSRARWMWAFAVLALLATAMQLFSLLAPAAMLVGVLVVRPQSLTARLRALRAPLAILVVLSGAWIVACIGEAGQVNWISGESIGSRLFDEVRGPVIGQLYDFVLFVIVVVAVVKIAAAWNGETRRGIAARISRDRDVLALTVGWALVPTLILSVVSFAHPIYEVRYVAGSAPGAALLVAFLCVRTFPATLDPSRRRDGAGPNRLAVRLMASLGLVIAVLLVVGYLTSGSMQQEDLQSPARFAAQHAREGDVIALPDHAITAVVDYYLAGDGRPIALWPQVGAGQRYVERLDLSLDPPGTRPDRVWLLTDGSVPLSGFARSLQQNGYRPRLQWQFNGSALVVYESTRPRTAVGAPPDGEILSGKEVPLGATAHPSGSRITKIQFVVSGGPYLQKVVGTTTSGQQGALGLWNTTRVPNGTYLLQSVATDAQGKVGYSPAITVVVHNARPRPGVFVLLPSNGATLSGRDAILGASADLARAHIRRMEFVLSGGPYSHRVVGSTQFSQGGAIGRWNTTTVPNGTYSLWCVATKAGGKTVTSPAITVKVDNRPAHHRSSR
jgi:hypothetical protein